LPKFLSLLNLKTQNQEIVFDFKIILDIPLEPLNSALEASFLTPHDSQLATAARKGCSSTPS